MTTAIPVLRRSAQGFTLVMALMLLAVMVLVVVGLLGSSISSRVSANNDQQIERARGAVRSGLASVQSTLEHATWNDDYVVLNRELNPSATADRDRQPVLMIARAALGADATLNTPCVSTVWNFTPLVSGIETVAAPAAGPLSSPNSLGHVVKSDPVTGATLNEATGLPRTLPWQPPVSTHWEVVYDPESQEPVARYCFWVEDMQAYLDLNKAGNYGDNLADSTGMMERQHERETPVIFDSVSQVEAPRDWYAGIAPGLRTPDDNPATDDRHWSFSQASLFSLISPSLPDDTPAQRVDNALMLARWMPLRGQTTQYASLLAGPEDWKAALIHLQPQNNWRAWLTRNPYDASKSEPDAGRLIDTVARLIEENSIIGTQPYLEYNLVPADYGVFARPREPKLNLNRVLEQLARKQITREAAVNLIADHIERHLPSPAAANSTTSTPLTAPTMTASATERFGFAQRSGAYPFPARSDSKSQTAASCRAYLQSLAAGMLDYADTDSVPTSYQGTATAGAYRGSDSAPYVTEHFIRYWQLLPQEANDNFNIELKTGDVGIVITHYNEIWNLSNRPVSGEFQAQHVVRTPVPVGALANFTLDMDSPRMTAEVRHEGNNFKNTKESDGTYWVNLYEPDGSGQVRTNNKVVTLKPNETKVLASSPVIYVLRKTNATASLGFAEDDTSFYSIRFKPAKLNDVPALLGTNPGAKTFDGFDRYSLVSPSTDEKGKNYAIIDRSGGTVERNARNVSRGETNAQMMTNITAIGYGINNDFLSDTNSDPRISFFVREIQAFVSYANGANPWGRTYRKNVQGEGYDVLYGVAHPAYWGDKGHEVPDVGVSPSTDKYHPFSPLVLAARKPYEPWHAALAPARISNSGRFFSVTELGNVYDPVFWKPKKNFDLKVETKDTKKDKTPWKFFWDIGSKPDGTIEKDAEPSSYYSGGHTLRIGRPEHRMFRSSATAGARANRGLSATALLDLFHCGVSAAGSTEAISDSNGLVLVSPGQAAENLKLLTGPLSEVNGHVNVNTAKRDVLRSLVVGTLVQDQAQKTATERWPALRPPRSITSATSSEADRVVDAIIRGRPYVSTGAIPEKAFDNDTTKAVPTVMPAFGVDFAHTGWDSTTMPDATRWNDAAAEEVFARLYNSSTVRSRNFRVFVTGQAIRARRSDPNQFDVLATRSKVYHVHIRPVRDPITGTITRQRPEVTYEQDL